MKDVAHNLHRLHEQHGASASGPGTVSLTAPLAGDSRDTTAQAPEPATPEPRQPDGRGRRVALAALGVAVVAALAFLLIDRDREPSDGGQPESSATTDSESSGNGTSERSDDPGNTPAPADASEPAEFVEEYYSLLPDDTEAAWKLLGPDMQDEVGSYDDYAAFWRTISSVRVDGTTPVSERAVDVEVTYTSDGGTEQETRRIRVEPRGGSFIIVGDEVV
jgi:hypothetical protein